ncbi:hypothetical protein BJ912DRAFT_959383 [Pholiota molesta]|nr:hypothetical protein BJ912DRAFT_959383 [Pholiota molesta]
MSVLFLPSTTDDILLDELSAPELFKYGRTCKHIHSIVQSYIRRRFRIEKLLATYFSPSEINHFRWLQTYTGMLISGSTALQFFNRMVYPDSDLDLYLEHGFREDVGLWLLSIGYTYVPRPRSRGKTFQDDLVLQPDILEPFQMPPQQAFIQAGHSYLDAQCVFTFVKQDPLRKVQMITSLDTPLERILNFHSTCVMNIITHNTAYSFFPRGTFAERRALSCISVSDETMANTIAQNKYRSRGWTIDQHITRDEFDDPTFAFARGLRYVGDAQCWTIPILPQIEIPVCEIESNSWLVRYDETLFLQMKYSIVKSPRLRTTYLIERGDEHLQLHLELEIDNDEFNSDSESEEPRRFLDDEFTDLINWYRAEHNIDNCELWAVVHAERLRNVIRNARNIDES